MRREESIRFSVAIACMQSGSKKYAETDLSLIDIKNVSIRMNFSSNFSVNEAQKYYQLVRPKL